MEGYAAIVVEHFFGELIRTQNLQISNVERIEEAAIQAVRAVQPSVNSTRRHWRICKICE